MLNLAFLDDDMKLGSVVDNAAYYNFRSGTKSATPAHIPQGSTCTPKIPFLACPRQDDEFGEDVSSKCSPSCNSL